MDLNNYTFMSIIFEFQCHYLVIDREIKYYVIEYFCYHE